MIENTNGNPKRQNPKSQLRLLLAILFGLIAVVVCANYLLGMIPRKPVNSEAVTVRENLRTLKRTVSIYAEDNEKTYPTKKQLIDFLVEVKETELAASIESGKIDYPNGGVKISKADPTLSMFVTSYKDRDGKSVTVTVPFSDVLPTVDLDKSKN